MRAGCARLHSRMPIREGGMCLQIGATATFDGLFKGIQELYGFEVVPENFDALNSSIVSAYQNEAHHLDVLKQFCGYERVILDKYDDPGSDNGHRELFAPTYRINMFMNGYSTFIARSQRQQPL